jgi:hypothetical protein
MEHRIIDAKQIMDAEHAEHHRQELETKERVRKEGAALVKKLSQTYGELTSLMQQNPEVVWQLAETGGDEDRQQKLKRGLERADVAPRCRWVKQDGTMCKSPQIRKHIYCYAHKQMMEARALALCLPALEDANAVQIALMRVQKALIDDTISAKKAGLLLYSLQLGITNIGQTTFGEADERDLATNLVDEEDALAEEQGLPRINTDYADRTDLPRINADERGVESGGPYMGQVTPKWDAMG